MLEAVTSPLLPKVASGESINPEAKMTAPGHPGQMMVFPRKMDLVQSKRAAWQMSPRDKPLVIKSKPASDPLIQCKKPKRRRTT